MRDIIADGAIKYMSIILGVCGTNFCTLISDGRLVNCTDKSIVDENYHKIRKINDNVIFGASGYLLENEDLLEPFNGIDTTSMSVKIVKNTILSYIKSKIAILPTRQYIIGGKSQGSFVLYEIHFDDVHRRYTVTERHPVPHHEFAISVAVPPSIEDGNQLIDVIAQTITMSSSHEELVERLKFIIPEVSKHDSTVGQQVFVENIF